MNSKVDSFRIFGQASHPLCDRNCDFWNLTEESHQYLDITRVEVWQETIQKAKNPSIVIKCDDGLLIFISTLRISYLHPNPVIVPLLVQPGNSNLEPSPEILQDIPVQCLTD